MHGCRFPGSIICKFDKCSTSPHHNMHGRFFNDQFHQPSKEQFPLFSSRYNFFPHAMLHFISNAHPLGSPFHAFFMLTKWFPTTGNKKKLYTSFRLPHAHTPQEKLTIFSGKKEIEMHHVSCVISIMYSYKISSYKWSKLSLHFPHFAFDKNGVLFPFWVVSEKTRNMMAYWGTKNIGIQEQWKKVDHSP